MTEQSNAELIAENRKWVRLHQANKYQAEAARRMTQVLDALEAAERERDRLDEAFDRDLPWRYDEVEAQRNQLAAVVEAARSWFDEYNGEDPGVGGWFALEVNLDAISAADALRERDAALIEGLADEYADSDREQVHGVTNVLSFLYGKARQKREEQS